MKVLRWEEFSELPPGTVFQVFEAGSLDPLLMLVSFCLSWERPGAPPQPIDFIAIPLLPRVIDNYELDLDTRTKHGLGLDGASVCHPDIGNRDGVFIHDERRFVVWEKEDRERLSNWLLTPGRPPVDLLDWVPRVAVES